MLLQVSTRLYHACMVISSRHDREVSLGHLCEAVVLRRFQEIDRKQISSVQLVRRNNINTCPRFVLTTAQIQSESFPLPPSLFVRRSSSFVVFGRRSRSSFVVFVRRSRPAREHEPNHKLSWRTEKPEGRRGARPGRRQDPRSPEALGRPSPPGPPQLSIIVCVVSCSPPRFPVLVKHELSLFAVSCRGNETANKGEG